MQYAEVMLELKSLGTSQNRKVYARHGVGKEMFGVSYANLGKLKKKIKVNHDLAQKLWKSGNHDARVLATMIADPQELKASDLDHWVKDLDNYVVTDTFSGLVSRTKFAHARMKKWVKAKDEWVGRCGWLLVAQLAGRDNGPGDAELDAYLKTIESSIHRNQNRVRDAMNLAVINIGLRNARLEKKAIAAAKRIGKVEVDHGETGCKTPDAVAYIQKTKAYRAQKKKR